MSSLCWVFVPHRWASSYRALRVVRIGAQFWCSVERRKKLKRTLSLPRFDSTTRPDWDFKECHVAVGSGWFGGLWARGRGLHQISLDSPPKRYTVPVPHIWILCLALPHFCLLAGVYTWSQNASTVGARPDRHGARSIEVAWTHRWAPPSRGINPSSRRAWRRGSQSEGLGGRDEVGGRPSNPF